MNALLETAALTKRFAWRRRFGARPRYLTAVDSVSIRLEAGSVLGIVGESGCGKSTLARLVLRLLEPDSGSVRFDGEDVTRLPPSMLRRFRRRAQLVFQDATGALDPRMRVGRLIAEPLEIHRAVAPSGVAAEVESLLRRVGLSPRFVDRFPARLSGGQRQRVAIARAIALRPELLVLDEPVSSLDATVQAGILDLLASLFREGMSMVVISHDLSIIERLADQVAVMYFGTVVESGAVDRVLTSPRHPYTRSLLAALPRMTIGAEPRVIPGDVPSLLDPPSGCPFHPRCPAVGDRCRSARPPLEALPSGDAVACHHPVDSPGS